MAQILVRNVDEDLKARLKEQAARRGVSMEEEARLILGAALRPKGELGLGSRIAALFRDIEGNDEPLPELPKKPWKPMSFDE